MKSSSPDRGPEPAPLDPERFPGSPLEPLDRDASRGPNDEWIELVRAAERPRPASRIGAYEIQAEIRGGGQGVVFRALETGTGRVVALKRLAAGALATPAMRRRFEREMESVGALRHPGIVELCGIEMVDGEPLLAMEWVDGRALTAWSAELPPGRAGVRAVVEAFLQVCAAVQHAHQKGVIHRDLKPSNVLVDAAGRCRVLDFGLARKLPAAGEEEATRTVGFVGTPAYAAPEHFTEGEAPLDVRSDVYSLGVVLYELLAGRRPFAQTALRDLIEAIEQREPPRPSSLAAGVGRELDTVVAKAMSKRPEQRYQSVDALAEDLRRWLDGRAVLAVPHDLRYVVGRWMRRNRLASALSLALGLTLVAAAAVGLWQAKALAGERDLARERGKAAEAARDQATAALGAAQLEARKAEVVQGFYLDSLLEAASPSRPAEATDVVSVLERAVPLLDRRFAEFPGVAVRIRAQIASVFSSLGRRDAAEPLLRQAVAEYEALDRDDARTGALLDQTAAELAAERGDYAGARPLLERAVAGLRGTGEPPREPRALCRALQLLAQTELALADLVSAEIHAREAWAIAIEAGEQRQALGMQALLGEVLILRPALEEAEAILMDALARAREVGLGQDMVAAHLEGSLAQLHDWKGDPASALPHRREALAIARRYYPAGHGAIAAALVQLGNTLHMLDAVGEAREVFMDPGALESDPYYAGIAWRGAAGCWESLGEPWAAADAYCEAWEALRDVAEPVQRERAEIAIGRAYVLASVGAREESLECLADAIAAIGACGAPGRFPRTAYVARARLCGYALGQLREVDRALQEMLAELEAGPGGVDEDTLAQIAMTIRVPLEGPKESAAPTGN